jgi:hypothetical protein
MSKFIPTYIQKDATLHINFIRPDVFHVKTKYNIFRLTHL